MAPDVVTVLINRKDGGVTVMRVILSDPLAGWSVDPTPEYIESLIAKHNWPEPLQAVSWEIVQNDIVDGSDRTFRNAWKVNGKSIGVDMPKAREIHRQHLRKLRGPLMDGLDVAYMRADEAGDQQAKLQVAAQKQMLRDVTQLPAIEAAQTPEELKAVTIPKEILNG